MNSSFSVCYSNRFEFLYEMLRDSIYSADNQLFAPRNIVVPSVALKEWLVRQFAFDPAVGVAAGLTFFTLDEAVGAGPPSLLELTLRIEAEGQSSSAAAQLAAHFRDWLLYDPNGWPFESEPEEGWHIFGFSHLAPAHLDLFIQRGARFYLLAPTYHYWGDLATDREALYIWKKEQQRGVSPEKLKEMTHYLADRNPLLANLGRLARTLVAALADAPHSEERFVEPGRSTLLMAIQSDLFELEAKGAAVEQFDDHSIGVCGSASRWAEVEKVREKITTWLASDPSRRPSDVLVLAPDISDYSPYIEALFCDLPTHIGEASKRSPLSALLDLATGRWEASAFLDLLSDPLFRESQRFSEDDVEQIRRWIARADIRWAEDADHRSSLLEQRYQHLAKSASQGTWRSGFDRLLQEVATGGVEMSSATLLGRWIDLFDRLRIDLDVQGEATVTEWAQRLRSWTTTYLPSWECPWLDRLAEVGAALEGERFAFSSILPWIDQQRGAPRPLRDLSAIEFCSIAPMQVVPAKLICLLGMEEGVLPRSSRTSSLEKIKGAPSPGDRDRYFFLEALLCAREALYITYRALSCDDGREQTPSLLVDELLSYIDHHYELKQPIATIDLTTPPTPQTPRPEPPHRPLPRPERLRLSELRAAVNRPCSLYCRHHFDLSLEDQIVRPLSHETFELPYRYQEQLIRAALVQPFDKVVEEAKSEGIFPVGPLEAVGRRWLKERLDRIAGAPSFDAAQSVWLELCPATTRPERVEGGWLVPPLEVGGVELVGRLHWTHPAGLPLLGKKEAGEIWKRWPDYLVHLALCSRGDLDFEPALLLLESAEQVSAAGDPLDLLEGMVDYTLRCFSEPSPLSSAAVRPLLAGDLDRLIASCETRAGFDPYLAWVGPSRFAKGAEEWQEAVARMVAAPFEQWGVRL